MKRALGFALAALMVFSVGYAADDTFSRTVQPADYSAAGLGKLTVEERARLDALVRDYKSGALEKARREAAMAATARAEAEARATKAEARVRAAENDVKTPETSLLARAKVLLTPGTQIEYTTVESRLVEDFTGWKSRTLFVLENGQRWRIEGNSSYVSPRLAKPAVKIVPGALGSFWMIIEGVKTRAKVARVAADGSGK